jgi:hypothetical protein
VNQTPLTPTSGDVTLTVTASDSGGAGLHTTEAYSFDGGTTRQSTNQKLFTANQPVTIRVKDAAGNTTSTGLIINTIDKDNPVATSVVYNPTIITTSGVLVTLTLNEPVQRPDYRSGALTGTTFTRMYNANIISGSVTFYDLVGNLGSTGIEITWIDTNRPTPTLIYNPATATSGDVLVTLSTDKIIRLPSGRSGFTTGDSFTKIYTGNTLGVEQFIITDLAGNTGEAEVEIHRIDKTPPHLTTILYSPAMPTHQDVEVTIEASESIQKPNGRTGPTTGTIFTKTYTGNGNDTVTFYDLVGNQGQS